MRRALLLSSIALLSLVPFRSASAMPVEAVPNPQTEAGSFVADAGGLLGPEWSGFVDGIARELNAKTGAELAVITVDSLDGISVEEYAVRLFQRFGIGKKGKDDGLLLLISRDDRKARIEVGYGIEGAINDAKAGRLLDEFAVPRFKAGEYGRGIYDTARAMAQEVAESQGVTLATPEPAAWPTQVEATSSVPTHISDTQRLLSMPFETAMLSYFVFVAGAAALGFALVFLRIHVRKAKAARQRVPGTGLVLPTIVWGLGGFALLIIAIDYQRFWIPLLLYAVTSTLITIAHIRFRRRMKADIAAYRLRCPKCRAPMRQVSERDDDRFLSREEVAEELAGGMDYEFWLCDACLAIERFQIKLSGAEKCPKCKRRTLESRAKTIETATTGHAGKEEVISTCANPGCRFTKKEIRTIPQESSGGGDGSSRSGSSGGGSSSGGSFGGGSSGGGGASRGW